jgi:hypothetical protein
MERILVLIDPTGLETASINFACYLTRLTGSKLTGLFLSSGSEIEDTEPVMNRRDRVNEHEATQQLPFSRFTQSVESRKTAFAAYCANQGLQWLPDMVEAGSEDQIIIESRFADLLIVNSDASFSNEQEAVPTDLVSNLLRHAECPVMIAPLSISNVDEVVFAYDGSPSSVFAIKQFTHLFPQLQDKKVTFIEVNDDFSAEIEFSDKITNYLKMHYSAIGYHVLAGQAEDELFSYFLGKKNIVVVIGAFGRKMLPGLFSRSTAHLLLKTTSLPVFVAHR